MTASETKEGVAFGFMEKRKEKASYKSSNQLALVAPTCDDNTWEVETEGLLHVLGQLGEHGEFEASLDYRVKTQLQTNKQTNRKSTWLLRCRCILRGGC